MALHTIQDSTSPAHHGFQVWHGGRNYAAAIVHVLEEDFDPGTGSQLDGATQWLWTFFHCPAPQLPPDFFENLGVDHLADGDLDEEFNYGF